MRRTNYLNVILTINAMLLTALLWTALAGRPLLATEATAQSVTSPQAKNPAYMVPRIPNAAAQRYDMIAKLGEIHEAINETNEMLQSGGIKVEVANLDRNRTQ